MPVTLRNLSHLGTGTELSRKVFNPLDKDDQLELEHAIAVNAFNDRLVELMNFSLRLELFFGASGSGASWDHPFSLRSMAIAFS